MRPVFVDAQIYPGGVKETQVTVSAVSMPQLLVLAYIHRNQEGSGVHKILKTYEMKQGAPDISEQAEWKRLAGIYRAKRVEEVLGPLTSPKMPLTIKDYELQLAVLMKYNHTESDVVAAEIDPAMLVDSAGQSPVAISDKASVSTKPVNVGAPQPAPQPEIAPQPASVAAPTPEPQPSLDDAPVQVVETISTVNMEAESIADTPVVGPGRRRTKARNKLVK